MIQPGPGAGSPKENIRAAKILCIALITGIVFFAAVVSVICLTNGPVMTKKEQQHNDIFLYIAAGLALAGITGARFMYKKKVTGIKNSTGSLIDKLNLYRLALISYMAPCEGAALFSIVALFLTGNFLLLIITTIMLLTMVIKFPVVKKIIAELNLDWKDQAELT